MEKDINDYVVRRIQEIKQDLEESKRYLQEDEEELHYAELRIEKAVKERRKELEEMGWEEDEIESHLLALYDSEEDKLDNAREEITMVRNHIFALKNDLIIYENFGR